MRDKDGDCCRGSGCCFSYFVDRPHVSKLMCDCHRPCSIRQGLPREEDNKVITPECFFSGSASPATVGEKGQPLELPPRARVEFRKRLAGQVKFLGSLKFALEW